MSKLSRLIPNELKLMLNLVYRNSILNYTFFAMKSQLMKKFKFLKPLWIEYFVNPICFWSSATWKPSNTSFTIGTSFIELNDNGIGDAFEVVFLVWDRNVKKWISFCYVSKSFATRGKRYTFVLWASLLKLHPLQKLRISTLVVIFSLIQQCLSQNSSRFFFLLILRILLIDDTSIVRFKFFFYRRQTKLNRKSIKS